jgi:hypothetical protein
MPRKRNLRSHLKGFDAFKIEPASCITYSRIEHNSHNETNKRTFGSAFGGILTILAITVLLGAGIQSFLVMSSGVLDEIKETTYESD